MEYLLIIQGTTLFKEQTAPLGGECCLLRFLQPPFPVPGTEAGEGRGRITCPVPSVMILRPLQNSRDGSFLSLPSLGAPMCQYYWSKRS